MGGFLRDVKDADKVGLLILYTGLLVCFVATCGYLAIVFHPNMQEQIMDRAMSSVKDFFGIGGTLITAAMAVLRFQSKDADKLTTKTEETKTVQLPIEPPVK